MSLQKNQQLLDQLFEIGAVRFGQFKLKIHKLQPEAPLCPIYFDLRIIRSFPQVMKLTVEAYHQASQGLSYDLLADIPLASSPIIANLAWILQKPMITPRPEVKKYGTKKSIEGVYTAGQTVLVVDDLVSQGTSKLEVLAKLREAKLKVRDILVLIDREQGGAEVLAKQDCRLHAVFKVRQILDYYLQAGKISTQKHQEVVEYLQS